jgi:hypothetical protein
MLTYDPIPWLMKQEGLPAVRARRRLALDRAGDVEAVSAVTAALAREQEADGCFEDSTIKTAAVLCLLADLRADGLAGERKVDPHPSSSLTIVSAGASYLLAVLAAQRGYGQAGDGVETGRRGGTEQFQLGPGSLRTPCDLAGFFGPYEARGRPEVMADGAREMNHYRAYEPLLGPKSPVRAQRRSSRDRAGPSSCYAWGLIPLTYVIEALCRAGYARDARLQPAIAVLLAVQRESGGWCRNLGGHPNCTLHALRALGSHPELRQSEYAAQALALLQEHGQRLNPFALLYVASAFDLPAARAIVRGALAVVSPRQRVNGSFGEPYGVARVAAVLAAVNALGATV